MAEISVADNVGERARWAKNYKHKKREFLEWWGENSGSYSSFFALNQTELDEMLADTTIKDKLEFSRTETVVINQIYKIIEYKNSIKDTSPTVILDFGGMLGISSIKLAEFLEKENGLVSKGEVVFVVTNLNLDINEAINVIDADKYVHKLKPDEVDLIKKHHDLVHFINSDASELRHQKITLPNGIPYALDQHIDIIHENQALMHGVINDVDLPMLGKSMSKYGILFLGSKVLEKNKRLFTAQQENLRRDAHRVGKANLRNIEFTEILPPNDLLTGYEVYQLPKSPIFSWENALKATIQNEDEEEIPFLNDWKNRLNTKSCVFGEGENMTWGIEVTISLDQPLKDYLFNYTGIRVPERINKIVFLDMSPQETLAKKDQNINSGSGGADDTLLKNLVDNPDLLFHDPANALGKAFKMVLQEDQAILEFNDLLVKGGGSNLVLINGHGHEEDGSYFIGERLDSNPTPPTDLRGNKLQKAGNYTDAIKIVEHYNELDLYAAIIFLTCNEEKTVLNANHIPVIYPNTSTANWERQNSGNRHDIDVNFSYPDGVTKLIRHS